MALPDDIRDELVLLALSGRADPLVDVALAGKPAALAAELAAVREGLGAFGLSAGRVEPSAGLKGRILGTLHHALRPPRRAVLVIDMQNDHLTPGMPLEVPRARAIVPALAARLDEARRRGIPVVYVVDQHEPGDSDLDSWGAHNLAGSTGVQVWPELAPRDGDQVVTKPTYSAFQRSRLAEVLGALKVDTLELTGCLTEVGIMATATDALQRGFVVDVPRATQAGAAEAHEAVALGVLAVLPPYGPARQALMTALAA